MTTQQILSNANAVKVDALMLSTKQKNDALLAIADEIENSIDAIICANQSDLERAKGVISPVMMDRLALDEGRIKAMADGVRELVALDDPVGKVISQKNRNGLNITKVRVPMGVVAIIYESRPNVTSDAAALCLKSGNVSVLRTGKEAHASAKAIVDAMRKGLEKCNLPKDLINLVDDVSRESANQLMTAVGQVDLLIPRGGAGLIKACTENAKVPCIQTGTGICHIYVDECADLQMALKVVENAKCSRPSVCNAMEVLLVNEKVAGEFLPMLYDRLVANRNQNKVTAYLDEKAQEIMGDKPYCLPADEDSFDTEFLDYKMAIKIVANVRQATEHIAEHSTRHSESIITQNQATANYFTATVDSSSVYVNASTRFTDGGQFGLGCEMGISTQKLHARGPMGLEELTAYKYVIVGDGNVR